MSRYRWIRPAVRGTPPTRRLAHAAAVVRLMDGELDGSEGAAACIGTETYMVVFGGVGTGAIYNDVHVLRWEYRSGGDVRLDIWVAAHRGLYGRPQAWPHLQSPKKSICG